MELSAAAAAFCAERHLATLTTLRADGSPHVVPVGFTVHDGLVRVITDAASVKARNAARGGRAAVCQVEGRRWLTVEGPADVLTDPVAVRLAEELYARRYRTPRVNPTRVVLTIAADRLISRGLD
ncbi:MAG: TIGR03618 family F420-dependent PPOX class oxidoreductase [Actinomycetales bacterium]